MVLSASQALTQEVSFGDLGTAKRGEYGSYKSKDGTNYKIGDTIKIGFPSSEKTFAFITTGDGIWTPVARVQAGASGQVTEIKKIIVDGTKRTGYFVYLKTKANIGLYTIQIENAITSKEIVSSVMTSDEALSQLKKAKDKLDLGLITQEEYNELKTKLAKYIN